MRSFGMRNTNRRGKGRGSGETINLYDSGQKQPEDMLQTIKGAAHRDSDAPLMIHRFQNFITTGSCEKEEMVAVASLK